MPTRLIFCWFFDAWPAVPSGAAAQLAGRAAEEWIKTLDAPARVAATRVPEMVAAPKIRPGQIVADVDAGRPRVHRVHVNGRCGVVGRLLRGEHCAQHGRDARLTT